jgi:hypothetical protein
MGAERGVAFAREHGLAAWIMDSKALARATESFEKLELPRGKAR